EALKDLGENAMLLEKAAGVSVGLGDFPAAAAYSEREVAVAPEHEPAWINLATFRLLAGDFQKSEAAAKRALERHPRSYRAYFHLGGLYEGLKLDAQAEDAYRKAAELAPDDWKVLSNLGMTLAEHDDPVKTREAVRVLER